MANLTREQVVAHVRLRPGQLTREIAADLGAEVHKANAHLTRAAFDGLIVQAGERTAFRWFPVPAAPSEPWSPEGARARLCEIEAQRLVLDQQERALRAFLVVLEARP